MTPEPAATDALDARADGPGSSPDPSPPSTTVAWSMDGRTFRCLGPLRESPRLGDYVVVDPPGHQARLGHVLHLDVVVEGGRRLVAGSGDLVDRVGDASAFDDATVAPASDAEVRASTSGSDEGLVVGTLRGRPDVSAALVASGFNRHTFLCGQSGSGKTYSLGVLLERLLLDTTLPLFVIDPNGDHVHLATSAPGVEADLASRYRAATESVTVMSRAPTRDQLPLHIRLDELGRPGMAALLELDPIADRHEYNTLLRVIEARAHGWEVIADVARDMHDMGGAAETDLALRIENLGILEMPFWAGRSGTTAMEHWVGERPRGLVADTSALATRRERVAVTIALLHQIWALRTQRRPLLLVVDEAHDVCPAQPSNPLEQQAVDLFTRVAGEGRKYGIHLLLSTQRPDKVPDNVLSQCDNLLLMRVNSEGDRAALADRFSFAPSGLVEMVGTFGLGEALLAGRVATPPVLARIGRRISPEGGADVPTDWAHPGPPDVVGGDEGEH